MKFNIMCKHTLNIHKNKQTIGVPIHENPKLGML